MRRGHGFGAEVEKWRGAFPAASRCRSQAKGGRPGEYQLPRALGLSLARGAGFPTFAMDACAQLCSWDNLLLAYRKAARGKRGQPCVAAFEYCLEERLLALQDELLKFTYSPGKYASFYIHEPKRRLISAAPFRDRVVHHALCNLIEPVFERSFIFDSYANRIGKGTHRALDRAQEFARRYPYVLQGDLRQFFPSIDHEILLRNLGRKIEHPHLLWLCDRILESGRGVLAAEYEQVYFPGDDLFAALRPRGLPIGNLTSQFFANVYLNALDHFVKRELRCPAYLRYVDDFLLFAPDKERLWFWLRQIEQRLAALRLTLHRGAQPRAVSQGIPYLGFVVYPQARRLKRRKGINFQRRFRQMMSNFRDGTITLERLNASLQGWVNHARYANTVGLRISILNMEPALCPGPGAFTYLSNSRQFSSATSTP